MLVMRERVRECLRERVTATARQARRLSWRIARGVLNRLATAEMRHAALLLGYDVALGHGAESLFRYLDEYQVGTELGRAVRYGEPDERESAVDALILELCLFN
jgi:hypothetical protein